MIAQGFTCKGVELSGEYVGLDLTIPDVGVELAKPLAKGCEFPLGESTNLVLDLFDL